MRIKYTLLGELYSLLHPTDFLEDQVYQPKGILNRLADHFYPDPYLRILDFSKPATSTQNSIDIRTDNITTAIHLPYGIPLLTDGILTISDGVIHMLPAWNYPDNTDYSFNVTLTNKVWNFDLKSQKWSEDVLGIQD